MKSDLEPEKIERFFELFLLSKPNETHRRTDIRHKNNNNCFGLISCFVLFFLTLPNKTVTAY